MDLTNNEDAMKMAYNPSQPFKTLVNQIETGKDYPVTGNFPYTVQQILNISYKLMYNMLLFFDKCKDWDALAPAIKIWANFKIHFGDMHQKYSQKQLVCQAARFHTANNLQTKEITNALQHVVE